MTLLRKFYQLARFLAVVESSNDLTDLGTLRMMLSEQLEDRRSGDCCS